MDLCLLIIGALSNALTLNVTGGKPDELEIFQEDYILANLLYVQDVFSSHILRKKAEFVVAVAIAFGRCKWCIMP